MTTTEAERTALFDAGPAEGDAFDGEVRIENVRLASEDGAFAVVDVSLADGSPLSARSGRWATSRSRRARPGQGRVSSSTPATDCRSRAEAEPLDPAGAEGARRYLKTIPGIGTQARRAA